MAGLDDAVQRAAGRSEGVHATSYLRVLFQNRRMVRLDAGIDHPRPAAAPVLFAGEFLDAVEVVGRIGSRERSPQEIVQRFADKLTVIHDDDEPEAIG